MFKTENNEKKNSIKETVGLIFHELNITAILLQVSKNSSCFLSPAEYVLHLHKLWPSLSVLGKNSRLWYSFPFPIITIATANPSFP